MDARTLAQHMPAQALAATVRHIWWENCEPNYDSVNSAMICLAALFNLVGIDEASRLVWTTAQDEEGS
jgi:hypothetical protein